MKSGIGTITVIVPVYNTCAFLPACVESILGQTYTDWELLLVDDGSTDGSLQIARQYAQAEPRIRVLHQENCGVSAARNQGIRAAGGSYICFVDSDDTIETSLLSDMAAVLQRTQADCVASGLTYEFEENGTTRAYTVQEGLISLPTDLNQRFQDLADARMLNSHCGKLFKKAILDACSIRMVEGISTLEDGIFLLDYLAHCSSIYCLSSAAYHYRQIPGSLQKRYSPNALQAWLLYAQKYRDLTTYLDGENTRFVYGLLWYRYRSFLSNLYTHSGQSVKSRRALLTGFMEAIHRLDLFEKLPQCPERSVKRRLCFFLVRHKLTGPLHLLLTLRRASHN